MQSSLRIRVLPAIKYFAVFMQLYQNRVQNKFYDLYTNKIK